MSTMMKSAGGQRALGRLAEDRVLGIGGPDRIGVVGVERMGEIADGGFEPLVVLLGLEQVRHQRLAGLRILGVAHRQDRIADMKLGRLADRSDRPQRVVHVVGDLFLGGVALGGGVDRDAVVGPRDFAGEKGLVVEGVIPCGHAGNHVVEKLLAVVERLLGLGRVEDDLVLGVDHVAAMRPQAPVHPAIGIAGGVAERHAAGRVVALGRLGVFQELVGGCREFGEARLLQRRDAVVQHIAAVADRDVDPLVAALAVGDRGRHPAAVFLAEIVGDVGDVDAFLRKQVRQREQAPEQIRTGVGIRRHRRLRRNVLVRFPRHIDLDAGRLGERVEQLHERVVLRLHEVLPAQQRQLCAFLGLPRRRLGPGLRPFQEAGAGQRAGRGSRGAALHEGAAGERGHGRFLPVFIHSGVFRSARRTDARAADRA
jgi:hypothetical protein